MAPPAAPFAQANMIADLQLLSVGAAEASPTSLVITDKDRYVRARHLSAAAAAESTPFWTEPSITRSIEELTTGHPNPIYHQTHPGSFMVNVGEGTQRLGMEHKVRLTRLFEHIFLTALTPECFGGLPGACNSFRLSCL